MRLGLRNIPTLNTLGNNRHRIVSMQAFQMVHTHPKILVIRTLIHGSLDFTGRVFTEHQVLAIQQRKLLLVFSLNRRTDIARSESGSRGI